MMRSGVLPAAALRASPSLDADQTSELLFGEGFALLDLTGGWAWGYCLADHYVGYLAAEALAAPIAPTHRVEMIEAMLHSAPDAAGDRKSTRLTPVPNAHLVCRLLLEQ